AEMSGLRGHSGDGARGAAPALPAVRAHRADARPLSHVRRPSAGAVRLGRRARGGVRAPPLPEAPPLSHPPAPPPPPPPPPHRPPRAAALLPPGSLGAVGIVALDAVLSAPDFRAGERAFALLWAAAEAVVPSGRVIAQTLHPDHYAIAAVRGQSRQEFYEPELAFRAELGYPPFRRLCLVSVRGATEAQGRRLIAECASALAGV